NSLDLCMGVRRASEGAMDHARQLQVIGVMADPAAHARVVFALHALADPGAVSGVAVSLFLRSWRFCRSGHWSPRSRPRRNGRRHFSRRILHGGDNVLVTGAAAEIAVDALANLAIRRVRVPFQEIMRAHDHARRAEATLQAVLLPASLLDGVQLISGRQAFTGCDLATSG